MPYAYVYLLRGELHLKLDDPVRVRRKDYKEEVVAKGVLCYELYSDGSVLCSNGNGIYRLDQKGSAERLAKDALIEQVAAVKI